jgi:hypothetical protein
MIRTTAVNNYVIRTNLIAAHTSNRLSNSKLKQDQENITKRRFSGRLLYVLWNTWKERNLRIFTGRRLTFLEVASLARKDIMQRDHAFAAARQNIPAEPD